MSSQDMNRSVAEIEQVLRAWEILENLREPEGDSVTLFCTNPDFGAGPNNAIEVNAYWTDWQDLRFTGETIFEALENAMKAKEAKK
jgi:hypothetical protein